jgi:hypothetical protein
VCLGFPHDHLLLIEKAGSVADFLAARAERTAAAGPDALPELIYVYWVNAVAAIADTEAPNVHDQLSA